MKKSVRLGTRGSKLALWQANWVKNRLENLHPDLHVEIVPIVTRGDRDQSSPLTQLGQTGVFVKEIERALKRREIDCAVHSAKDLPSELAEPFELAAITAREDPRDVLLSARRVAFTELPRGAHLATGSPRRKAQLLAWRLDLHLDPLRGNLDTRVQKMLDSNWDGILAAWAGVKRLGLLRFVTDFIPLDVCLPAAGQGALALEIGRGNEELAAILQTLADPQAEASVQAERAFLKRIGAGCHHPVGVLGQVKNHRLHLQGVVATPNGATVLREEVEESALQPQAVGRLLAENLLSRGAEEILHDEKGMKKE